MERTILMACKLQNVSMRKKLFSLEVYDIYFLVIRENAFCKTEFIKVSKLIRELNEVSVEDLR